MYGILRDVGIVKGSRSGGLSSEMFDRLRDVFWFDTFDFRKIKPSRSNFAWSITTNGVGMCTTFEMPPEAMGSALAASYSPSPGDVVIGNDPGRINIYYMWVYAWS